MANSAKGVTRANPSSGGWVGGIACGILLAVAPAYAVLLGGSLAPGLAAWVVIPERPRRTAAAMLLFGLAATAHRLRAFWSTGGGINAAWDLLTDPLSLTIAWFACAFGWALTELLPLAVVATLEFEAQRQALGLRKARRRAADGWELEERPSAES